MKIDIKGRNVSVPRELSSQVQRRFAKIDRQVSELAHLELELSEERNPAIADSEIVEATLVLKGATLRAKGCSPDLQRSLGIVAEELARQVKRDRDKRRRRREARTPSLDASLSSPTALP
jgi:putative sigma-54 modulation protein